MAASRIGVLTGGGDCPGLNAVIRAIVRRGVEAHNLRVYGFDRGWQGVLDAVVSPLTIDTTRGILHRGGTILGTSRTDPEAEENGVQRVQDALEIHGLDGLIVLGGEGTLAAAAALHDEHGIPIVGVPKTIDNDVGGTDWSVGFSTALEIATEAVDRLHSTAESHNRVMLLEVMGRHAGWIAVLAGMAGGADAILIPEQPFDVDAVCRHIRRRHGLGRDFSIVMVAEGATPVEGSSWQLPEYETDQFGRPVLGGIANALAPEIERRTGYASRTTILGHVQRGGTPTPFDRVLGSLFGVAAVDLAVKGDWGQMVAMVGNTVETTSLKTATGTLKTVPQQLYETAEVFFG